VKQVAVQTPGDAVPRLGPWRATPFSLPAVIFDTFFQLAIEARDASEDVSPNLVSASRQLIQRLAQIAQSADFMHSSIPRS